MMHEFRLPSLTDPSFPTFPIGKNIPANDSWAICRIFKKTSSLAQRVLSHSGPQLAATSEPGLFTALESIQASQFALESSSCLPEVAAPANWFASKYCLQGQQPQQQKPQNPQDGSSCKIINFSSCPSLTHASNKEIHNGPIILPFETQTLQKSPDVASMILSIAPGMINSMDKASPNTEFGCSEPYNGYAVDWPVDINGDIGNRDQDFSTRKPGNGYSMNNECEILRRINFPFDLGADSSAEWRCNMPWESLPSPLPPTEVSNICPTDRCNT